MNRYENKEERWRIERRFPCPTGETAYCICNGTVMKVRVVKFVVYGYATYVFMESDPFVRPRMTIQEDVNALGDTWFLDKRDAVKRLSQMPR